MQIKREQIYKSRNRLPQKYLSTLVEISKKVDEIIDENDYKNGDLLITKEHIHQNINELISNAIHHINVVNSSGMNRQKKYFHQYHVDNRGRLIIKVEKDF